MHAGVLVGKPDGKRPLEISGNRFNNNNIYLLQLVTTKFKSGGLHEKHAVATWNVGNHLSICF